jgi:Secretion system C-terminal sorting domain
MKKILSILAAGFLGFTANAQCSNVANNFEIKLVQTNEQTLKIQLRHHAGAVADAKNYLPTTANQFDGLVLAITWPNSSNVSLNKCTSTSSIIDLMLDNPIQQNKMSTDNLQTLFHNNITTMPKAFDANWVNDKWYDVATVSFTGQLAKGDYFSLLNCDYGLAHPNSYTGNSTTDPWMSMFDASGNYIQVSPKMITELPTGFTNTISVYPVPTTGELNIDVDCASKTSAVVKVLDINGRLVKTVLFELEKGKNTNTINIGELPLGEYMIQLTDGKALNFTKQITKI